MQKSAEKRSKRINPVYNEDEFDKVRQKAFDAGLTPSSFVRLASLDAPLPQPVSDRQLLAHVSRIGGNLNQSIRHLNHGNQVNKTIMKTIAEAVSLTQEIRDLILYGYDDEEEESAS